MLARERRSSRNAYRLPEASQILKSFQQADKDGSGSIDVDELALLLESLNPNITTANAKQMFAAADIDGNNRVDFGEFVEFIFSDSQETESILAGSVMAKGDANSLKAADPNVTEDPASFMTFQIEDVFKHELSNAYMSFVATYPESAAISRKYIEEQSQRLMSKEFEERIAGSFGGRLDKDGDGVLSYQEVRGMIREVLSVDTASTSTCLPTEAEIQKFFDTYNTVEFGKNMGSSAFLNLMRALNIHLIAVNLPALQKKWRSETLKEAQSAETVP